MARKANDRLHRLEQIGRHRAVGSVAGHAVFHHRRVLVDPGAHVILVAFGAHLIAGAMSNPGIFVGVVAARTRHPPLSYRVVRGIIELRRNIPVAFDAKLGRGVHVA